jgi:streptogramin lyase
MNKVFKKKYWLCGRWQAILYVFLIVFLCVQSAKSKVQPELKPSMVKIECEKSTNYKTLWQWSESVDKPKFLREPHSIHLDNGGNLLIADMGASRIMRFTPKGEYLSDLGKGFGSEDGYFDKPRDVSMDSKGNIVVTDQKTGKHRVQVFDLEGNFLRSFADEGSGPGQINWPHGLAFDNHDRILVTDVANKRVNLYNPSGKFIKALGQNGPIVNELSTPHSLAVDPEDGVFISDYSGTVQKFTINGDYVLSFKPKVHTEGSSFIHSICSDNSGNVYLMVRGIKGFKGTFEQSRVEDRSFYIVKYNNSGEYVCTIYLSDKKREIINAAVDSGGKIYALFKGGGRMGVEVLSEN